MSCEPPSRSGQDHELKCEPESQSKIAVTEAQQLTVSGLCGNIGSSRTRLAPRSKGGRVKSQPPSKDTLVIDLTMGDERVVVSYSTHQSPNQDIFSGLLVAPPQKGVAELLENWYNKAGREKPPPCAVGPRIASRVNKWKTGQQVLWSYMGLEEMTVRDYQLDGFENNNDRFIFVAQGPTQGPFIIKLLPNNKHCEPPVPYHIWKGLDKANPEAQANGFEREPSIFKCIKFPKDDYGTIQTAVVDHLPMSGSLPVWGRFFDTNTQNQPSRQPVLSGQTSRPQSQPHPQMTVEDPSATTPHENARDAIFTVSTNQSYPERITQQALPLDQTREVATTGSPLASPSISQTITSALPMPPPQSIAQSPAPAIWHDVASGLQGAATMIASPSPDWMMPPTTTPSPALAQPQYVAKALTPTLSLVEQQSVPHTGRFVMPYTSSQQTHDKDSHGRQERPVGERNFCQGILTELMDQKHFHLNHPFLQPVDPVGLNVPTYFQVIKQPMDLSTIQQKLTKGDYEDAEDFAKDVKLIFDNCSRFNHEFDPVYQSGQLLGKLFAQLWLQRTSCVQGDYNREVNAHVPRSNSDPTVPQEPRSATEPMTALTISAASPTRKGAAEVLPLFSPSGEEVSRAQLSMEVAETLYAPHLHDSPDTTALEFGQDALITQDDHQLANSSDQTRSNALDKIMGSIDEHSFIDDCLRMSTTSPAPSEESWDTLRSSRETSYTSEMLKVTEREFLLSQSGDRPRVVHFDDCVDDCLSPGCKRKWESTKDGMDEAKESSFVKKMLTMHSSQMPFQVHSPGNSKGTCVEMVDDDLLATALRDKHVPSKEAHEHYEDFSGKTSGLDVLPKKRASWIGHSSVGQVAAGDELGPRSGVSPIRPTSPCPVAVTTPEITHESCMGPSNNATEREDHRYLSLSDTPTEHSTSRLSRNYGKGSIVPFKHKARLTTHVKTVHLRRKKKLCRTCGRRFGKWDALNRHLKGNRCQFTRLRTLKRQSTEDTAPTRVEPSTAQTLRPRRVSPPFTDQHQSAPVEDTEDTEHNQERSRKELCRVESHAMTVIEPSPAPNEGQQHDVTRSTANLISLKHEAIENEGFIEIPAFPVSTTLTSSISSRLKEHIRKNVIFYFYTPAGKITRARYFSQCCDVDELFGDAITAKAFGTTDQKKKAKGNVLSIHFRGGPVGRDDDRRVKENDKADFDALADDIERMPWWTERNRVVTGQGILEVRAVG